MRAGDYRQAPGGLGFLFGGGRLTYGREKIFEAYYTAHVDRGLSVALTCSTSSTTGYNRARGPVFVPSHFEF